MLVKAMENYQVLKRDFYEAKKAQHVAQTGADGAQDFFRSSSLGYGDRKLIYKFFEHNLPTKERSAKNLRQLENGDYVHKRYQTAWEEMGVLISSEARISSRDDEYLKDYPWELAGHYDGELDLNLLRAYGEGHCKVIVAHDEETGQAQMEIEINEDFANSIGFYEDDYEPIPVIADIKSINPWGFKRIVENNLADIQGYLDQIMSYMYLKNCPYGVIFFENKATNEIAEVWLVWEDLHEGVTYVFDDELFGEQTNQQVRVTINTERFFGSEDGSVQGIVGRLNNLWQIREGLIEADKIGNIEAMAELMPPRCCDDPAKFPCSWSKGKEKCEFYDHCWNSKHNGIAIRPYEECPPEARWVVPYAKDNTGELVEFEVDSRKVPAGVEFDAFKQLVQMGALDVTQFLVDIPDVAIEDALESSNVSDDLFTATGELKMSTQKRASDAPTVALEFTDEDGNKAINCLNCGRKNTYQRLGSGGTKKCAHCSHVNQVVRED